MKNEYVTVARIRRAWGRRGEVIADLHTDFPERFESAPDVLLDGAPARIEEFRVQRDGIVLKFAGVDDISAAEKLAGGEVQIEETKRRPLESGAVYWDQLAGCRVIERGIELGVVRHIDPTVGTPVLVVDTPQGGELLVPFAEEICKRVDVDARVIEVELPEGLRGLNS